MQEPSTPIPNGQPESDAPGEDLEREKRYAGRERKFVGATVPVVLTIQELSAAIDQGKGRYLYTLREKEPIQVQPVRHIGYLVLQAIAEMALAKYLGEYWTGRWGYRDSAGPAGIHVRWMDPRSHAFRFNANKIPNHRAWIVAVSGYPPNMIIVGGIHLEQAMADRFTKYNEAKSESWQEIPPELLLPITKIIE